MTWIFIVVGILPDSNFTNPLKTRMYKITKKKRNARKKVQDFDIN
jgi:hypothetical protein